MYTSNTTRKDQHESQTVDLLNWPVRVRVRRSKGKRNHQQNLYRLPPSLLRKQQSAFINQKMSSWEIRFSKSRQLPYFYDSASGASTWERPEAISEEQITSLPGAHYLQQHANGSGNGNVPEGQVRASHLLVKHRESRRPSSWKEVSLGDICIHSLF